jgi:hypothetical protein
LERRNRPSADEALGVGPRDSRIACGLVYLGYGAWQDSNAGQGLKLTSILTLVVIAAVLVYPVSVSRAFRRPAGTV